MLIDIACQALRQRKVLELSYDGCSRMVEVHAVGWTAAGHAIMRAWQLSGGGASGDRQGWKLMRMDEARGWRILEDASGAPRKGYKRGDPAMSRIVCEL